MSKIKVIKLTQGILKPEVIEIDKDKFLDECYKHINCRCIDVVTGIYDDFYVDIVVDDEGLLRDDTIVNPIAWFLYSKCDFDAPIVGNAILCGSTEDGDTVSLSGDFLNKLGDLQFATMDKLHELSLNYLLD